MHSPCIYVDGFLSALEYTAPIHSPSSHPNTSLLRARWTPARILRPSHIHHGSTEQLMPAVCGETSVRSACTLRAERPRRTAAHFFPHTRPPDTPSHFSQQHHTSTHSLKTGAACEQHALQQEAWKGPVQRLTPWLSRGPPSRRRGQRDCLGRRRS